MADTVDLMVVGTIDNASRKDLEQNLVKEFGQDASAFQELLDAACGDTAEYAAQSDVDFATAESGKQQLEKLGIKCVISSETDSSAAQTANTANDGAGLTDFTDELGAMGSTAAVSAAAVNADSDAAGDVADDFTDLDFSDDLEFEGSGSNAESIDITESAANDESSDVEFGDDDLNFEQTESEATDKKDATAEAKAKSDIPDALASTSFEELEAELVDPTPVKKEKSEKAELDDGGLSLTDDAAPLTKPKAKSNPDAADDGGLSIADDSNLQNTADSVKPEPDAKSELVEEQGAFIENDTSAGDINALDTKPETTEFKETKADDAKVESLEFEPLGSEDSSATTVEEVSLDDAKLEVDTPQSGKSASEAVNNSTPENTVVSFDKESLDDALPEAEAPAKVEAPAAEAPAGDLIASVADQGNDVASATADIESISPAVDSLQNQAADSLPVENKVAADSTSAQANLGGLVLPGQPGGSVVPLVTAEEDLDEVAQPAAVSVASASMPATELTSKPNIDITMPEAKKPAAAKNAGGKKKIAVAAAAVAGVAVLVGGGTYAFKNAGSIAGSNSAEQRLVENTGVDKASQIIRQVKPKTVSVSELSHLESISTEQLLADLSQNGESSTVTDLEPYFLESVNRKRSAPRIGAAVPAVSESMKGVKNRVPHPADQFFDEWSNREADLLLFLGLLDGLIEKGDLEVAQQLSDRAKDKLFAVMSSQRLARAYSDAGDSDAVARLMKLAARDSFAISSPEERVIAMSDFGMTEQAIGLNENAMDTFLKASILTRNLNKPESRTVGLSSSAHYFHNAGRRKEAKKMLSESITAAKDLPENTAARNLAIRYVAVSEGRMGLFNQALKHVKLINDPVAAVSAYHGIALAIESSGDLDNARRVLNMAFRAGSGIENPDERSQLLNKVVLASETE